MQQISRENDAVKDKEICHRPGKDTGRHHRAREGQILMMCHQNL